MDVMHGRRGRGRGRIHSETNMEFCCLENKNSYEIHSMLSNLFDSSLPKRFLFNACAYFN